MKLLRKILSGKIVGQSVPTASNYKEACELLLSGHTTHVLLNWDIGEDELFSITSDWCDASVRIRESDNGRFIISIQGFQVSPQSGLV